jgi:hypothetical protein
VLICVIIQICAIVWYVAHPSLELKRMLMCVRIKRLVRLSNSRNLLRYVASYLPFAQTMLKKCCGACADSITSV